jgi:hypothetical protein
MATIQTARAVPVLVLGVVLITMPAWAEPDPRAGVPPIQSHQPMIVCEGHPHGAQSMPTSRGGLPADSLKTGCLNLRSGGGGVGGSRTTANVHAPFNSIRSDALLEHDAKGPGIPLWRW